MAIELNAIVKQFGSFRALRGVSLTVEDGEFIALLGPSGSGKTTLLRILAGLEFPDAGSVRFGGEDVAARPARERGVGFVFQHYALFRHMTVAENIGYGLRVRKAPKAKIRDPLDLHELEERLDLGADLGLRGSRQPGPHAQTKGDVLEDAHVAEQRVVLEHEADVPVAHALADSVLAVDVQAAGVGPFEAGDDAQQCGLARARGPEQRHQLAGRDVEVQIVADDRGAETFVEVADFDAQVFTPGVRQPRAVAT